MDEACRVEISAPSNDYERMYKIVQELLQRAVDDDGGAFILYVNDKDLFAYPVNMEPETLVSVLRAVTGSVQQMIDAQNNPDLVKH